MVASGNSLYAGGDFTKAGNCTSGCNYIAKWDGSKWSDLDSGTNAAVFAIDVKGSYVYAGGDFTSAGSCKNTCYYIAKYGLNYKSYLPIIIN